MSLPISISSRAEQDLTSHYLWYHDNASPDVAERFLETFDSTVKKLAEFPSLGRVRNFKSPQLDGIRSSNVNTPFASHLIFYSANGGRLNVERVIHGARDLDRLLTDAR